MEIVILTGMSGAGKSIAVDYLEDMGFFCVDNLPPQLLLSMVRTFLEGRHGEGYGIHRLAFVVDVRSAEFFNGTMEALDGLTNSGYRYRVIYLDCADNVLISRYKQSRRNHPMAERMSIVQAIKEERERLEPLRNIADQVIDTSNLDLRSLRNYLYDLLSEQEEFDERLSILVESFGFKYGIPADSDEVLDVRFIPNPYYDEALRPLCGLDEDVYKLVLGYPETQKWLELRMNSLDHILPYYVREGKVRLTLAVGCTGGRHRSVALTEELAKRLKKNGYRVLVKHRDIDKDQYVKRSISAGEKRGQANEYA